MTGFVDFSDLDDLDAQPRKAAKAAPQEMKCPACAGSGKRTYGYVNIVSYPCKMCQGRGKVTDQRVKRVEAFKKGRQTAAKNLAEKIAKFKTDLPHHYKWLSESESWSEFARSLLDSLNSYGRLSDKQLAAIDRALEKQEAKRLERAKATEAAAVTCTEAAATIQAAFSKARENKVARPKMRFGAVIFSRAPDTGSNKGAIYVTYDGEYAGKVAPEGKFLPNPIGRRDDVAAELAKIFADPMGEAVAYGKREGVCSCCGRKLDNKISIDLGIGPICREKFF